MNNALFMNINALFINNALFLLLYCLNGVIKDLCIVYE